MGILLLLLLMIKFIIGVYLKRMLIIIMNKVIYNNCQNEKGKIYYLNFYKFFHPFYYLIKFIQIYVKKYNIFI